MPAAHPLKGNKREEERQMTQRDAFWNRYYELARQDTRLVVVTADMGAPSLDRIRKEIPNQFVNVGIAEQNAILVASGLALQGKHPFVYAIAPFITLRCLEQIRVENAIMNIPITIVGVGAGFGYDDSGPTHHLIEDIACLRSMPNLVIHSISDNVMAAAMAEISCSFPTSNYIRLDRKALPDIYHPTTAFTEGVKRLRSSEGGIYLVATGFMVHTALEAARRLEQNGVAVGVIDVYSLPIAGPAFINAIAGASSIVTLEEHFLPGGFGSAVLEALADMGNPMPVHRLGISHEKGYCYQYGGREIIHKYYGIDVESVTRAVLTLHSRKSPSK